MLRELVADNKKVVEAMRECHEVCDKHGDVATASILENFIDQAERRVWFMFEASRKADNSATQHLLARLLKAALQAGAVYSRLASLPQAEASR